MKIGKASSTSEPSCRPKRGGLSFLNHRGARWRIHNRLTHLHTPPARKEGALMSDLDPNRPRTILHYKCETCGQTEYKRIAEHGDRKRKGWCKNCKQIIYPVNEVKIVGRAHEF